MGRTLFHVGPTIHQIGDHLQHGRYGSAARAFGPSAAKIDESSLGALMWEMALETARLALAPRAVSRLGCLFACETLEMARAFRDRFRKDSVIYEVEPWRDAELFRGDFDLISQDVPGGAFVDFMPQIALRYWTQEPRGRVEVLVGGPMDVRAIVEPAQIDRGAEKLDQ